MKKFLFPLIVVGAFIYVAALLLIQVDFFNKATCTKFGYTVREEKSDCVIMSLGKKDFQGKYFKQFLVIGKVQRVIRKNNQVIIFLKVKSAKNIPFVLPVKLISQSDRTYQISKEERQWVEVFDNKSVTTFRINETDRINDILKRQEVMALFTTIPQDDEVKVWEQLLKWNTTLLGQLLLLLNGIVKIYVPVVSQVGY